MLIVYLFLECLSTMASELFSTEELFYGTTLSKVLIIIIIKSTVTGAATLSSFRNYYLNS